MENDSTLREKIAMAAISEFPYTGDTLAIAEKFVTMRDALIDARLEIDSRFKAMAAEIHMNERRIEEQENTISDLSDQLSKQSETGKRV